MVGAEQFADRRMDARQAFALRLDFGPAATHLVHVGRRAADVADRSLEFGILTELLDFLGEDRLLRPRLDDPTLMSRDRAEGAAAEAAAHDRNGVLDHLERGDRLGVARMRPARVRQIVDAVHVGFGQRQAGRRDDDGLAIVILHQRLGVQRVRVRVDDPRRGDELRLVGLHLLERRDQAERRGEAAAIGVVQVRSTKPSAEIAPSVRRFGELRASRLAATRSGSSTDPVASFRPGAASSRLLRVAANRDQRFARWGFAGPEQIGHAAEVAQIADRFAGRQPSGDLDDRLLAHAVDDEVGLRVAQDRSANGVAPVVVMPKPTQRRFDAAGNHGGAGKCFARASMANRGASPGRGAGRSGRRGSRRRRCGPSCSRCSG